MLEAQNQQKNPERCELESVAFPWSWPETGPFPDTLLLDEAGQMSLWEPCRDIFQRTLTFWTQRTWVDNVSVHRRL